MTISSEDLKGLNNAEIHFLTTAYYGKDKAALAEDPLTPVSFLQKTTTAFLGWFTTREAVGKRLGVEESALAEQIPEPISIEFLQDSIFQNYSKYIKPLLEAGKDVNAQHPEIDAEILRDSLFTGPQSLPQFFVILQEVMQGSQEEINEILSPHVQSWWETGREMREFHQKNNGKCSSGEAQCGGVAAGCPVASLSR